MNIIYKIKSREFLIWISTIYTLVHETSELVFEKYVFEASHWSGLYGKILHG